MAKTTIFLSHISEEARLGTILKDRLESDFLSFIDVFVSSDSRSIPPGDAWLKAVDENLERAAALIVLASPTSVARPWITFEAGAGWAKKVPTMIVCHSGMAPGGLPLPMGQLQAFLATDLTRIRAMYGVIAGILGGSTPEPDLDAFVGDIQKFEMEYTEERDILSALRKIHAIVPSLIPLLNSLDGGLPTPMEMPESLFRKIEPALDRLKSRGFLIWDFRCTGISFPAPGKSGGGNLGTLTLTTTPRLANSFKCAEFN